MFCLIGELDFKCASIKGVVNTGQNVIFPAKLPHIFRCPGKLKLAWFILDQDASAWSQLPNKEVNVRKTGNITHLLANMEIYLNEQALMRSDTELILNPLSQTINVLLQRELMDEESYSLRESRNVLEKIWHVVHESPQNNWTVEKIAKMSGRSVVSLYNWCNSVYGVSPMRYVRKIRMQHAANIISNTSLSMSDVAGRIGYDSQFAFSKAFKQEFHISPYEFKKYHWLAQSKQGEFIPSKDTRSEG